MDGASLVRKRFPVAGVSCGPVEGVCSVFQCHPRRKSASVIVAVIIAARQPMRMPIVLMSWCLRSIMIVPEEKISPFTKDNETNIMENVPAATICDSDLLISGKAVSAKNAPQKLNNIIAKNKRKLGVIQ